MYPRLIALGMLMFFGWIQVVQAQQQKSLAQVDSLTYQLFQQKRWPDLIVESKQAIRNGIDYYYLRVRLGLAYFEKGNYHEAVNQFEKALSMNASEEYIKEYLYYSYLWAGRTAEAKIVTHDFSDQMKRKTGTQSWNFVEKLDLAYNYSGLTDPRAADNFTVESVPSEDGFQYLPRKHDYFYLGMQHHLHPRFSIYHGYSGLRASHLRYTQSSGEVIMNRDFQSSLHQYYASGNLLVTKGLSLMAGFHFLHLRYPLESVQLIRPGRPNVVRSTGTDNNRVLFGSLYKRFSYLTLGGSVYHGTIGDARQLQKDVKLILYPRGNLNLYILSVLSHQRQRSQEKPGNDRFLFEQQVGIKTTNWLWLEAYTTFGEMENFILNDGVVIFNRMDVIKQRLGGRLIIAPIPRWQITLDYTHLKNESQFFSSSFDREGFNQKEYTLHSLTGLISWRF